MFPSIKFVEKLVIFTLFATKACANMDLTGASDHSCSLYPTPSVANTITCTEKTCKVACLQEYKFANGYNRMNLECVDGKWMNNNFEYKEIPDCKPICMPFCMNGGICTSPGVCSCLEGAFGKLCENKACPKIAPVPKNSNSVCTETSCESTCRKGYQLPDGNKISTINCLQGAWTSSHYELPINCEPVCEKPCKNEGKCAAPNLCRCPADLKGPQCQYQADNCLPKTKLDFNGKYSCTSNMNEVKCSLSCDVGVQLEFEPEPFYTCKFETGEFLPKNTPHCKYGA